MFISLCVFFLHNYFFHIPSKVRVLTCMVKLNTRLILKLLLFFIYVGLHHCFFWETVEKDCWLDMFDLYRKQIFSILMVAHWLIVGRNSAVSCFGPKCKINLFSITFL